MPSNGYYSYGSAQSSKKKVILWTLLIILLFSGVAVYFLLYRDNGILVSEDKKKNIIQKLIANPQYITNENLFFPDGKPMIEYLRQKLVFHKYSSGGGYIATCRDDLRKSFPGEKGRVIVQIFELYLDYREEKMAIEASEEKDAYEKIIALEALPEKIFSKPLAEQLFPVNDYDLIHKFFRYAEHYLKNNYEQNTAGKRDHIEKSRRQIYGKQYRRLKAKEPLDEIYQLELKILQREMSLLSDVQKEEKRENIYRRIYQK